MKSFRGRIARVRSLAYSSDGALLASAGKGGLVRIWNASEGDILSKFRVGHRHVTSLAFGPDDSMIAATTGHLGATLWSTKDYTYLGMLHEKRFDASSLCFLQGTQTALTCGIASGSWRERMGSASLWDLDSGRSKAEFNARSHVFSSVFRPDGNLVAMGSSEHGILFWDPGRFPKGSPLHEPESPGQIEVAKAWQIPELKRWMIPQKPVPYCVRFSPDNRLLAATGGWSILIYDLARGEKVATLRGHRQAVTKLDFSPDGRTLASSSFDGKIRFWDVESGLERASYDWEMGSVDTVAFSPDGMTIAAGGEGGIVVWDVE